MWWLDCGDHASTLDLLQEYFVPYCSFENGLCTQFLPTLNLMRCFVLWYISLFATSNLSFFGRFSVELGRFTNLFTFSVLIRISPTTFPWNNKSSISDISSSLGRVNQKTSHRKLQLLRGVLEDAKVPNMSWELCCPSYTSAQTHRCLQQSSGRSAARLKLAMFVPSRITCLSIYAAIWNISVLHMEPTSVFLSPQLC